MEHEELFYVKKLEARYGKLVALQIDELMVPKGKVLIVGPNGSGKTTLIKVLLGLMRPKKGHVRILSIDPLKEAEKLYRRLTYVRDKDELPENLRVRTLLDILAESYGSEQVTRVAERLGLLEHINKRLGELSRGMRRRASLLIATASNRDLIVIDEPFSGLDANGRRVISEILDNKEADMIIISHIPLRMTFDYLILIDSARVTYHGPYRDPRELGYDIC